MTLHSQDQTRSAAIAQKGARVALYAPTFGLLPYSGADKKMGCLLQVLSEMEAGHVAYTSRAMPGFKALPNQGSALWRLMWWVALSARHFFDVKISDSALPLVGAGENIWIIHDPKFLHGIRPRQKVLRYLLPVLNALMRPRVITVSEYTKGVLERHGFRDVTIVHNSIDARYYTAPRAEGPKDIDIIYVANDMPHKRHRPLLRLLRRIGRRRPLRVVFVGSRLDEAELSAIVAGSGVQLEIVSGIDTPELIGLVDRSKCTVFASRYEGFGIPLIEAYVRGMPIVCADLEVFRETDPGVFVFGITEANILAALEAGDRRGDPPQGEGTRAYAPERERARLARVLEQSIG